MTKLILLEIQPRKLIKISHSKIINNKMANIFFLCFILSINRPTVPINSATMIIKKYDGLLIKKRPSTNNEDSVRKSFPE